MKYIFLTGKIQIGKSTVIQKVLSLLGVSYGGFRTYFDIDRDNPERCLYIGPAGKPLVYSAENAVACFSRAAPPAVFPERFDTLGADYIEETAKSDAGLIVMDELGNLENEALRFQSAILSALEGKTPVLGVIKLSSDGWVNQIRNHPDVTLITVDEQNRNELPEYLASGLFTQIHSQK